MEETNQLKTKGGFIGRLFKHRTLFLLFVFVLTVVFIGGSIYIMKIEPFEFLRFAGFYFFCLFFPGYLIARKLADKSSSSSLYAYSLFFGIALTILFYFLDVLILVPRIGHFFLIFLGGPILCLPSILFLVLDIRKKRITKESFKIRFGLAFVLLVTIVITFSATTLVSGIGANRTGITSGYHDMVWNVSNAASLEHGWPAAYSQFVGKNLDSHYFANLFRACLAKFSGCSSANAMFVYSPFVFIPFLIFALDCIGTRFLKGDKKRAVIYIAILLFVGYLSTSILHPLSIRQMSSASEKASLEYGILNLLYVPNGIDLAVPTVCLLADLICRYFEEKKSRIMSLIGFVLMAFVLSGSKFIFTVCVLGALVGSLIFLIIQKDFKSSFKLVLLPLICISLGFGASYYFIRRSDAKGPATEAEPVYYQITDADYESHLMEYINYLDARDYKYIAVFEGYSLSDGPVIRQDEDGYYYCGGEDLQVQNLSEEIALDPVFLTSIDDRGIIGGAGKEYIEPGPSFFRVENAVGFLRITQDPEGKYPYMSLFYGKDGLACEQVGINDLPRVEKLFEENVSGNEYTYSSDYSHLSLDPYAKNTQLYQWLDGKLHFEGAVRYIVYLLFIPLIFFMCRPITSIPFILWIRKKLKNIREITLSEMLLTGISICGLIVFFIFEIEGNSQLYFFLCAVCFIDLIGVSYLFENREKIPKLCKILLSVLALIGIVSSFGILGYQGGRGVKNLYRAAKNNNLEAQPIPNGITYYEKCALDYISENTPEDTIIATNRYKNYKEMQDTEHPIPSSYSARYYYVAAYSERQVFLGAWAYMPRTEEMQELLEKRLLANKALFDPLCKNRRELMEKNHISYLVAFAYTGNGYMLTDPDLECVYRNRDVSIYKLKETF